MANASDCWAGIQPNKTGPFQVYSRLQEASWGNSSSFDNQQENSQALMNQPGRTKERLFSALHRHLMPNFKASFEAPERRSPRSPGNTYPLHSPLLANVLGVEAGRMPKADQSARGRGATWLTVLPAFDWIDNRCLLVLWVPERRIQNTSWN